MNVIVAIEHRFVSTPDGAVWTESQFPHSFWRRYLEDGDRLARQSVRQFSWFSHRFLSRIV